MPHQFDNVGGKLPEGVGEMLDRDPKHLAQRSPTLRDLVLGRILRQFMQPLMRDRVRADLHAGSQPLVELIAAHQRLSFPQKLRVPAVVRPEGAADNVTGGSESIPFHERRCHHEGVGVPIVKREHDTTARGAITQPGNAFARGDATQAETTQRPQLPLEAVRTHVQQLEGRVFGRHGHVVITENRKRRHDA